MVRKKDIPDGIRLAVLDEAGYQCTFCGHRDGLNLTVHTIYNVNATEARQHMIT
jgi:hypothetical protein